MLYQHDRFLLLALCGSSNHVVTQKNFHRDLFLAYFTICSKAEAKQARDVDLYATSMSWLIFYEIKHLHTMLTALYSHKKCETAVKGSHRLASRKATRLPNNTNSIILLEHNVFVGQLSNYSAVLKQFYNNWPGQKGFLFWKDRIGSSETWRTPPAVYFVPFTNVFQFLTRLSVALGLVNGVLFTSGSFKPRIVYNVIRWLPYYVRKNA